MSSISELLFQLLNQASALPFLFIGAGLSRRYLKTEGWHDLLERFAQYLPNDFQYYFSSANGDLPSTASAMAIDFHDVWWHNDYFMASRTKNRALTTSKESCLKIAIAEYIQEATRDAMNNINSHPEIAALRQCSIDGIITTNWDTLLESTVFPSFHQYIGQDSILVSNPLGIGEIFKIHGCVSDPNSMVLTKSDYAHFNERNHYLSAKLLTMFVEHPIIFLGYSISDENIRLILNQLCRCLSGTHINLLKDKLIFIQRGDRGNVDTIEHSFIDMNSVLLPVTMVTTDDFLSVYSALGQLERKIPAYILRSVKEKLYSLILSRTPEKQLRVIDIEAADKHPNVQFVYGVGVIERLGVKGYDAISRDDLVRDIFKNESEFDANSIINVALPRLYGGRPKVNNSKKNHLARIPSFKYLRLAGVIDQDGSTHPEKLPEKIRWILDIDRTAYVPPKNYIRHSERIRSTYSSFADMVSSEKKDLVPIFGLLFHYDINELKSLEMYLRDNVSLLDSQKPNVRTYYIALCCYFDWMIYSPKSHYAGLLAPALPKLSIKVELDASDSIPFL